MAERMLDVYCMSNIGLHVRANGHNILIDALNNDRQYPYTGISQDMAQTIILGRPLRNHPNNGGHYEGMWPRFGRLNWERTSR